MQFSDLYDTQLDIELSSDDQTELFTTAKRKKAVNDAVENFVKTTKCTKDNGTIAIVDGTQEYNIESSFTNFIELLAPPVIRIAHTTNPTRWIQGDDLVRRTPEWLDREEPGWRAVDPGTPQFWYIDEDGAEYNLGMHPPPDVGTGETWSWYIVYLAQPTAMSADTDKPFTVSGSSAIRLQYYHQALVHYAAGLLEVDRKNYNGYERQMRIYAGFVAQYLSKQREAGPSQISTLRNYLRESSRPARPLDPRRYP
jgi:hypothetical protein